MAIELNCENNNNNNFKSNIPLTKKIFNIQNLAPPYVSKLQNHLQEISLVDNFWTISKAHQNFPKKFTFDFKKKNLSQNCSKFNNSCIVNPNITKWPWCTCTHWGLSNGIKGMVEGAMGLSNGTKSMVSLATRMLDHELQKSGLVKF